MQSTARQAECCLYTGLHQAFRPPPQTMRGIRWPWRENSPMSPRMSLSSTARFSAAAKFPA